MIQDSFLEFRRISRTVAAAQLLGVLGVVLFSLQSPTPSAFAAVASIALLLALAAFAIGGVIGFIFGIPKSLQDTSAPPPPPSTTIPRDEEVEVSKARIRYAGNTSLEQISDWLTKIIVGVGLTQLVNIPPALGALGTAFGGTLGGFAGSLMLAPLEVVFFGIGGFFLGYLWTRLNLVSLLVESDEEAMAAAEHDRELRAIEVAAGLQAVSPAAGRASVGEESAARRHVLWVDDRPLNNSREIDQLEAQGISVTTATSTDAALMDLTDHPGKYHLIITDMARGLDRRAGFTLLNQVREARLDVPVVIYAGSGSPDHDTEARRNGALGSTNSPIRLFEIVGQVLRQG